MDKNDDKMKVRIGNKAMKIHARQSRETKQKSICSTSNHLGEMAIVSRSCFARLPDERKCKFCKKGIERQKIFKKKLLKVDPKTIDEANREDYELWVHWMKILGGLQ